MTNRSGMFKGLSFDFAIQNVQRQNTGSQNKTFFFKHMRFYRRAFRSEPVDRSMYEIIMFRVRKEMYYETTNQLALVKKLPYLVNWMLYNRLRTSTAVGVTSRPAPFFFFSVNRLWKVISVCAGYTLGARRFFKIIKVPMLEPAGTAISATPARFLFFSQFGKQQAEQTVVYLTKYSERTRLVYDQSHWEIHQFLL
jgi:hypothetical protein